jgi:hypothetical protein
VVAKLAVANHDVIAELRAQLHAAETGILDRTLDAQPV